MVERHFRLLLTVVLAVNVLAVNPAGRRAAAEQEPEAEQAPAEQAAAETPGVVVEREAGGAPGDDGRPPVAPQLRRLVEQLGHIDFSTRERATEQLLLQGLAAKPALLAGMKHPDLEIRMRSHQILARAMQSDFERRMAAFIADVDDEQQHDLPGWSRFREQVGGDPKSRKLFVEMLKHEADLLETFEQRPDQLGELLSQRIRLLQQQSFNNFNFRSSGSVEPASIATILFLGAEKTAQSNSVLKSLMYSVLNQSPVKQVVRGGSHAAQLRGLLESWIVRTEDESQPYYGLMLALNYDLKDAGLNLGRRYLKQDSVSAMVVQYGAIAVGRFGGKQDLAILESHLDNKTVCHTWSNPRLKKELIRIQIRDIVLAMLIQITGQSHKEYGFDLLEENPVYLFQLHTFAFLEDQQRDAALAKWKTWRESHADADSPAKPGGKAKPGSDAKPGGDKPDTDKPASGDAPAAHPDAPKGNS